MSQSEVQGHTQVSSKFDLNLSVLEGFYEGLEGPFSLCLHLENSCNDLPFLLPQISSLCQPLSLTHFLSVSMGWLLWTVLTSSHPDAMTMFSLSRHLATLLWFLFLVFLCPRKFLLSTRNYWRYSYPHFCFPKDMCIEESGRRRDKEGGALGHAKRREGYLSPLEQDSQWTHGSSSFPDAPKRPWGS